MNSFPRNFFFRLLCSPVLLSLLFACARQGSPTGGPKDTDPPEVVAEASTRNFSTRFSERRIELAFNEWVVLSDVGTQVVISPPLKKRPDITLKGKKVIVEFSKEDTLRPNTTYTINFGTAVKDFHENNPAKDLRFVFSTGDFLDSLSANGIVVDAFTSEPLENISVMLYDDFTDSVVRKEKPYYFARTDKSGQFSIQNVREGVYKVAAIDDSSGDLKWDGQNERIGFADSLLTLTDSANASLSIKLFKNQPTFRLFDSKTLRFGLVQLTYTDLPDSVAIRPETPDVRYTVEKVKDTLFVWYDMSAPAAWQLMANDDTVRVRNLSREDFLKNHALAEAGAPAAASASRRQTAPLAPAPSVTKTVSQHPTKQATISFNSILASVDTAQWLMLIDSTPFFDFSAQLDSTLPRNINVQVAWAFGKTYTLTLLPGAVTDFYGVSNADTLVRILNVYTEKQLGGLNLTVENLIPGTQYVLQLLNGTVVEEERVFDTEGTEKKLIFTNLVAAAYTARLIEDRNGNGRWDTGDYFARRQPEPIFTKKLDPLRANWEVEASMQAGEETRRNKTE